jgi:hypothetical protein
VCACRHSCHPSSPLSLVLCSLTPCLCCLRSLSLLLLLLLPLPLPLHLPLLPLWIRCRCVFLMYRGCTLTLLARESHGCVAWEHANRVRHVCTRVHRVADELCVCVCVCVCECAVCACGPGKRKVKPHYQRGLLARGILLTESQRICSKCDLALGRVASSSSSSCSSSSLPPPLCPCPFSCSQPLEGDCRCIQLCGERMLMRYACVLRLKRAAQQAPHLPLPLPLSLHLSLALSHARPHTNGVTRLHSRSSTKKTLNNSRMS